ncbi:MAG TPA: copper resistance CopC family protein [Steroidobacteraceae bacterium]|nr:copper resistance CopC family protein [Steroidobacteraceae bacterium]
MKRLMTTMLIAATLASPAFAHTKLKASVPADGSTVETAPAAFMLSFSEPARLTALSVQKEGGAEQKITGLPTAASAEAKVAAPKLENGRYTLTYRLVGADGHVINGKVSFTVGGKAAPGAAPEIDHSSHKH